jgi:CubicO group peptidase (beta-lactamase class C family)
MSTLLFLAVACSTKNEVDSEDTSPVIPVDSGQHTGSPIDPRFEELQSILEGELEDLNAVGVSIAIMENGEISFAKALGSKSAAEQVSPDTETLFQLGSVTKMLTSIGLLQQVQTQGLDINGPIAEHYPESEFAGDESWNDGLTIANLLSHRSGMYDWLGMPGSASDAYLKTWFESVFFPNLWLMNPSGLFYNYSNPNFSLAGLLMEEIDAAGRTYPDIMQEEVFTSLGMNRSYLRKSDAKADGNFSESVGYIVAEDGSSSFGPVTMAKWDDMAQGRPAGSGTWSTPTQMMEVARFILDSNEDVLDEELRSQMLEKQISINNSYYKLGMAYGYGIISMDGLVLGETYYPETILQHDGATTSFSATFWVLPEKNAAFCILSNGYGSSFGSSIVAALELLMEGDNDASSDLPVRSMNMDDLDFHDATYTDEYNFGTMEIRRVNNTLTINMPTLDELGYTYDSNLIMAGEGLFYLLLEDVYYDLRMEGPANGPTEYVVNRAFVGTRNPIQEAFAPVTPHSSLTDTERRQRIDRILRESASPISPLALGLPRPR